MSEVLKTTTIRTPRLTLRPMTLADAQTWYDIRSYRKIWKWTTAGRYRDVSQAEEWIKKYLSNPEAFNFMIELNDSELDGHSEPKPIGSIGTPRTPEVEPHQKIVREIGFLLTPTAWGKGYATEAARAIVKAIFEKTEVTHVVARTDEENQGSWNALQKVGFRRVDRKEYENVSLGKRIFLYYEIARPGYAIKGEEVKDTKDA